MSETCVSIDLEMTSARPESQEVIEIAAIKFRGERVLESWSTLVRPESEVPYGTQVLTGIDPRLLERAPALHEVAPQLKAFVGDLPLVAHTVSADVGCLRRQGVVLTNPQYDTFELASILLPRMGSYSLAALAEHFGIPFPQQHRAAHDALVTKQLFLKLLDLARELELGIIQEINRLLAPHDWPLKEVFRAIEAEKSRTAFGPSVRQAIAAKAGVDQTDLDLLLAPAAVPDPLRPTGSVTPIDVGALTDLLKPDGALARHLPGYEYREPQIAMLRAVARTLNEGGQLLVEAGTGTGKSIAYLVPSIYFAAANGRRVVVSTNTINLQDQLILKDLPDLQRSLPVNFRATVVKGRTNYLCLQRLAALRRRQDLSLAETLALIKILVWLPTTETGDVSELNLTDAERPVWAKLYAHPDICTPATCRYARRGQCFLYRARARAEAAHVVVVNHALLLSDVVAASRVLPDYEYLIVDEAHHLEDEATDQLGFTLQPREISSFLDDLMPTGQGERRGGLLGELPLHFRGSRCPAERQHRVEDATQTAIPRVTDLRTAVDAFFRAVAGFVAECPADNRGYEQRVRLTPTIRSRTGWTAIRTAWEMVELRLIALQEALGKLFGELEGLDRYGLLEYEELMSQLASLIGFGEHLRAEGNAIICNPLPDRVYWIALSASGEAALHSAPLNVAPLLRNMLFGDKSAVILTSATLTTAGTFTYMKERLGLEDADELMVGSPFDYASSTLMLLPTDMPEPEQPLYQKALHQVLERLCAATEGRALVLFTSHAQLRAAWQAIHQPLARKGILVLGHGVDGAPRRQLLHTFKTNPRTVLLGASSFWEGVDIVGDALSVLVITRIPFSVPSDPVVAARSELFNDPFREYSLPQAILRFRQGFGRLIRSQSDRGVVVVLDRRIQSKSYGAMILRSLPRCTVRTVPVQEIPRLTRAWLDGIRAQPRSS
jgi:predicted DnaQ family exonuclease/DinG family helicase